MSVYIQSIKQISFQKPLCEQWLEQAVFVNANYNEAKDPDFKPYFSPIEARRMGKLIKRAIATSSEAIKEAGLKNVDSIVVGSGFGCLENTEKFLLAMIEQGEQNLQPTPFIQSTYNTIASQIAIYMKNHCYNSTYSQQGLSFESALFDTFLQIQLHKINNSLVGAHEEMPPTFFKWFQQLGTCKDEPIDVAMLKQGKSRGSIFGNCAVSMVISNQNNDKTICKIQSMKLFHQPDDKYFYKNLNAILTEANLQLEDISAVIMSYNGNCENDHFCNHYANTFFSSLPILWYKHLFGESLSASSFGVYVGAKCLQYQKIPQHLFYKNEQTINHPKNILVHNHFKNQDHSLILLSC